MTTAQRALGALAGGLLVASSLPPWGWWPLAYAGIAVFELSLGTAPTRRQRGLLGGLFGVAWLATGTAWMWQLSVPGYVVAAIIFGLYHSVAAMVAPTGRWSVIGRPVAHTLAEALRFSWPFGGAPLASLAISQAAGPLAGVVRVGGAVLLTWVVFQAGSALGALVRPLVGAPGAVGGAATGVAATGVAAAGLAATAAVVIVAAVAPRGHGTGVTLDVAAIQGGGEQGTRATDVPSEVVTRRHLEATRTILGSDAPQLVVWPENVVDVPTLVGSAELAAVAAEAERLGAPIAVGVTEDVAGTTDRFTNAQVVITPEGAVTSRYDKVRRVPFGEYVPLRGPLEALGAPLDQVPNDAVAGTTPAYLDLPDGTRVGVVISWEVFFGGRSRDGVREGAGVILNPTNGASYSGTIVQTQQVASSRLRAIETGRWVVQAAPTGFSAFVSPGGEVIDRTSVGERAVIRHIVELRGGHTWYTRSGDAPVIVALMVLLLAIVATEPVSRRLTARRAP